MKLPTIAPRTILRTVDSGKWRCGLAVWFDSALVHASEPDSRGSEYSTAEYVVRVADEVGTAIGNYPAVWVAETPQTYEAKNGREGNLEELRAVVDGIDRYRMDGGRRTHTVVPFEWKGNVPKEVHHIRILAALSVREREIVETLPRARDALDAVGLGLFVLGRLGRGGRRPPR